MKRFMKIYLPSVCITFTLTLLCTCILNLLFRYNQISIGTILQMLAFIIVIDILDYALCQVDFKTCTAYTVTELVLAYALMLIWGYFGHWFSFTLISLIIMTIIFLVVFTCVHSYFHKISRMEANEINAMLDMK